MMMARGIQPMRPWSVFSTSWDCSASDPSKPTRLRRAVVRYVEIAAAIFRLKVTDVPICFVHGGSDSLIKCEHSARMYKLCRNPLSELHVFTKSEHARSVFDDRERYSKIVADFSKKIEEKSL